MVIVIASGKGGVGKSQVAINLTSALSQIGFKPLLIDGNLPAPDISLYLDIPMDRKTFNDLLAERASPEEVVVDHAQSGLRVVPSSVKLSLLEEFDAKKVSKGFDKLKNLGDAVIIDSPPGLGKDVVQAARAADKVLIVATPDIPSLTGAYKSVQLCKMLGKEVAGVILNRTGRFKSELSDAAVTSMMDGLPILGKIPEDRYLAASAIKSMPVMKLYPHAPSSRAFKKLACTLTGQQFRENAVADEMCHLLGIK